MEQAQKTKTQLQQQAAINLETHKRLIAQWATGVGKSGIVLEFIKMHPHINTLIVVPETNNIENWDAEFEKFAICRTHVQIICYASLKNYVNSSWDLLCLDECPHANTDLKLDILSSINATYVLALGAIVSEEEEMMLKAIYGPFKKSVIDFNLAINMNILPFPEIRVCHMLLDNKDRIYNYEGKQCTAAEKYLLIHEKVKNSVATYNSNKSYWAQQRMNIAGLERKKFLGEQKTQAMYMLCDMLNKRNKRFICFCISIDQAEKLGKTHAFTSHSPKSMHILEKFNNHEINSIYVVGKLIEGQNLKDIDCGVIGQIGGKERITVQQIGRVIRSKNPIVYIPIFDGTKDESFITTLNKSISNQYIKHYKL